MKKNILFLIGTLTNGGSERSIINVANEISKYHNVLLVCCNKKTDYKCNFEIIEIKELRLKKNVLKGIRKLRKIKKDYHIDTTISYLSSYNFLNGITKRKDQVIISIRNMLSKKEKGFSFYIMNRISNLLCNKIVCCCENVKEDQIKNYKASKEKTVVIENFCEDYNNKNIIHRDNPYIVSISRLELHKGNEHIIKAMSLIDNNLELLIFGKEKEKQELDYLKDLVEKYHLEKKVFFMGFEKNINKYLKESKALVLASDYEGCPNVILEAMSMGTPVIATDSYGGVEEILADKINYEHITNTIRKEKYGILVPNFIEEHRKENVTEKEKILKEAIEMILNNKETYNDYHKASLKRIKNYDKKIIIEKWLKII